MTNQPGVAYELALLQFRPDVTSEESLNVGVVLFAPELAKLEYEISDRYGRVKAVYPTLNGSSYRPLVNAVSSRVGAMARNLNSRKGELLAGPRSLGELLRELTPQAGGNFGWSELRFGLCEDLKVRCAEVFQEYVGRHEVTTTRDRIDDDRLWKQVVESESVQVVFAHVNNPIRLEGGDYARDFRASWTNGHLQVAEPITLDYQRPGDIVDQAVRWKGIVDLLAEGGDFRLTAIVTDPPDNDPAARVKYDLATGMLRRIQHVRAVIPASSAGTLAAIVKEDLHLA